MKFNEDNKQVKEFSGGNWFGYGVHKVHIGLVELGETDKGLEYVEVTVLGDSEEEDTARVWFTTDKAANYSFNVLRQIYVHNAPEAKKDQARDDIDATADTKELVDLLQKCVGGECWFTKYPSTDRTYKAPDGSIKKSIDKNIMGYEPKLQADRIPRESDKDAISETFDGAQPATGDAASNVPKSW